MGLFRKKSVLVKVYQSESPKGLAKQFEKDARNLAKQGYLPVAVNDHNVGIFGMAGYQVRTVTYTLYGQ